MIVSIVYLVFGLALTSMCINVVQVRNNEDLVIYDIKIYSITVEKL
jgi:hypothetical protein